MNFLAHAYLSFDRPEIVVGNLVADTVKGRQIEAFPRPIQQGIKIHREIDNFTDKHPVNLETKLLFREVAGRYDASFLDVAYDHFLASHQDFKPNGGWNKFAQKTYAYLEEYKDILPKLFLNIYVYMLSEDWLANYHNRWLIERSFDRLKRRASFLSNDSPIFEVFESKYDLLEESFSEFFPDLNNFASQLVQSLD